MFGDEGPDKDWVFIPIINCYPDAPSQRRLVPLGIMVLSILHGGLVAIRVVYKAGDKINFKMAGCLSVGITFAIDTV